MRKSAPFLICSIFSLSLLFCSNNDELVGIEQDFTANPDNTSLTINAEEPTVDENVTVGQTFDGPDPVTPDSEDSNGSNDDDGDGFTNSEDNIPDVCTKMVVTSNGVSSARITLNDDEIYSPNDFKNDDFIESTFVNLNDGDNTIFVRVTGSPGDQLNVRFYNCTADPAELVFETTVTRSAGAPNVN